MTPDPSKIQAVQEWLVPSNITDAQQFLGLTSYYRHYMQHFSHIAAPVHALTQMDAMFSWTEACQQAFMALKVTFSVNISSVSLFYQPVCGTYILTLVTLDYVGAVLEQDNYVCYCKCKLHSDQIKMNYISVIQNECLAIVYATNQFRHYLLARQFQLYTDHIPFQWLSAQ